MRRPVQWSRAALDDLKDQVLFIAREDPDSAARVAGRVRDTAAALGEMATGRPGRVIGTYEKSITRLPYVIAYALMNHGGRQSVIILRVIHTVREWTAEEWPP
ncbi:type II toxin-antitoxin system RelE/ParE family toxin [Sinorhizobium meliloti]|uniref:type II toxin-antitoxin system RelE/ParE family toxin n=1 Tax=Rhizobium meliloti TaxID=382 RepID=UPI000FD9629B|nr:type II toxin-antitoxin system RelE/ParE family toxin [Sinorhizobium meliloti]RVI24822.1 type II toxin-antitoxin system RelE/ParE family toxin [Sinorhizobium meliloti]